MRKRIWRLAEDQFDSTKPEVKVTPSAIVVSGEAGTDVTGSFTVESVNQTTIRGLVYSTNPYITCPHPQFEGERLTIPFVVKVPGAHEGESLEGTFVIVCNQAVAEVPVTVHFEAGRILSSMGEIRTLQDFAKLAQLRWNEALKLFFTDGFRHVIDDSNPKVQLLYKGYRRGTLSSRNLEEFLIASDMKERVTYDVAEETRRYEFIYEDQKETIILKKHGWGFANLNIRTEGDFLSVEPPVVGPEMFLGDEIKVNYYIHVNKMHAGRNFGKIIFDDMGHEQVVTVIASTRSLDEPSVLEVKNRKTLIARLYRDYESYRLKRMTAAEWCNRWVRDLEELRRIEHLDDQWYQMLQAMALLANGQQEEALWIISDLRAQIEDHQSPKWAFLLYLCTQMEVPAEEKERLTGDIDMIFHRHPKDVRVFWFLLQLRQEYAEDPSLRYKAIRNCVMAGYHSPLFLMEAYDMLQEQPYLMTSLDQFAIHVLSWMRRHRSFPPELAMQLPKLLENQKEFKEPVLRILTAAYESYPTNELLGALVGYMLMGNKTGEQYLTWYAKAVEAQLSITGLYEAYLMSMSDAAIEPLPQILTQFFQFSNNLPNDRLALLYSSVITYRQEDRGTYDQYKPLIDSFAANMIRQGRIDDNLAIIYNDYLKRNDPTPEIAEQMAPLLFVHKVACLNPQISRAIMYHEQLAEPVMATIQQGIVYLPVYTRQHVMLLESADHAMICDENMVVAEPLMDIEGWVSKLSELAPAALPYLIYRLSKRQPDVMKIEKKEDGVRDQRIPAMLEILQSRQIDSTYKQLWAPMIIEILTAGHREDVLMAHCGTLNDVRRLHPTLRAYVIGAWIKSGQYHKAFMAIKQYPVLTMDHQCLIALVEHLTDVNGDDWSDDFLLSLCGWLLEQGESMPSGLLHYLNLHYVGPTKRMVQIWNELKTSQEDLSGLEERILVQELYAEEFPEDSLGVYEGYRKHKGNRRISDAYLNYWSHAYMVNGSGKEVPEHIFHYILEEYSKNYEPGMSARYALTKRLAMAASITAPEYQMLDYLLGDALNHGIYFNFYRRLDPTLARKYQIYDRFYIEVHHKPGQHLIVKYTVDDRDEIKEEITEMYDGIYVRPVVIFEGQQLDYQIFDEEGSLLEQEYIRFSGTMLPKEDSAYDRLNYMAAKVIGKNASAISLADKTDITEKLKEYQQASYIAGEIFPMV